MAPFPSITDLYSLRPIEGDRQRVQNLGWYIYSKGSWLPENLVPPEPDEPVEASRPIPAVAPSWGGPVSTQSTGYQEKKEVKMTDMTSPTIGKLDIDVNKGAGMDPVAAALMSRGTGDGFGGMNGIFGLAALGLVFGRGGGLFGNGDGAGAAVAAGETREAIYNSSLSNINATHAGQLSALQSAATTNLAISNAMNESTEAIGDVKATVAASQALVQGAVAQVGLENCRQFGDLSTQLAVANGTARTEAVASEARLSTTILQGQNALGASILSGFNNVERGQDGINQNILLQGCQTREAIKDCCCETQKGILATQNQIAMTELRTTQAISASTQTIMDKLNQDKISDLQDQLAQARLDASQTAQTLAIENALKNAQASQPSVEVIVSNVVNNLLRFMPNGGPSLARAA